MDLSKATRPFFLDISTTNIELAKLLAASRIKVVVVSNMIDILQILVQNPMITVIGTGGTMYQGGKRFYGSGNHRGIEAVQL